MRPPIAFGNTLWRTLGDNTTAAVTTLGTQVYHPIGLGDDVQVVFNHHHGVAGIDQSVQYPGEVLYVRHVQADGRFVEHIKRVLGSAGFVCQFGSRWAGLGQFGYQLDALGFAAA